MNWNIILLAYLVIGLILGGITFLMLIVGTDPEWVKEGDPDPDSPDSIRERQLTRAETLRILDGIQAKSGKGAVLVYSITITLLWPLAVAFLVRNMKK